MSAPIDLIPFKEEIKRMFCEEKQNITYIAKQITAMGQPVKRVRLRTFINELKLTRDPPVRQEYSRRYKFLKDPGTCLTCGKEFMRTVAWHVRCRTCIPSPIAHWRYKTYGITHPEFETLLLRQDNKCAICFQQFAETGVNSPYVDHDHSTNKIRGLLCSSCNVKLAGVEQQEWHQSALRYLEK